MKKPRKKRWGKPHRRIERTPKVRILEMAWYKKPREGLKPAAKKRQMYQVAKRIPKAGENIAVHTHPWREGTTAQALPSPNDLNNLFTQSLTSNIRTGAITRVTPNGKEIGRTFIKIGKKFRTSEKIREKVDAWLKQYLMHSVILEETKEKQVKRLIEMLKEAKSLGIRVRFVPMKGYYFDERKGDFVKKEQNKTG